MGLAVGTLALIGTGAGLALSAAGTGYSVYSSQEQKDKMNQAAEAEVRRQQLAQRDAGQIAEQSIQQSTPAKMKAEQQKGTDLRAQQYAALQAAPLSSSTPSSSALALQPQTVSDTNAQGRIAQQNASQARLGGITEWDLQQQIKNIRANQQMAIAAQAAHGSASLLPWRLGSIGSDFQQQQAVGTGVSSLGNIAGTAGATLYQPARTPSTPYIQVNNPYGMYTPSTD